MCSFTINETYISIHAIIATYSVQKMKNKSKIDKQGV